MFFKKIIVFYLSTLCFNTVSLCGLYSMMNEKQQIDSLVQPLVKEQNLAGVVVGVVDKDGSRVYSFGSSELQGEPDLDGETVFEIGSLSKVFTSLLMESLVQKGKTSWNTDINTHLSEPIQLLDSDNPITLLHLSTHSSGLARLPLNLKPIDYLNPYKDYDATRLYAFLSSYRPSVSPGEVCEYSNLGAAILGHIAEKIENKSYDDLVGQYIFDPLKMSSTGVILSPSQQKMVCGYSSCDPQTFDSSFSSWGKFWLWFTGLFKEKTLYPVKHWDWDVLVGAGGIKSTADDLLLFLSHCAGIVSNSSSLQKALLSSQNIQKDLPQMKAGMLSGHMAKGWIVSPQENGDLYWHSGATYGGSSFMGFNKEQKKAVVVLANTYTGSQEPAQIGKILLSK